MISTVELIAQEIFDNYAHPSLLSFTQLNSPGHVLSGFDALIHVALPLEEV
jgi:hypothetical protein